jgi:AcrR family transcriptional regulator
MEDKKADIYQSGKELFSLHGFKDTNVSDITKSAGIAVGSFYKYYASKEQLFIEIFINENENLKRHIMEAVDLDGDPVVVIKNILLMNLQGTNSNPILKEWYNKELAVKLEKTFYEMGGMENIYELMYSGIVEQIQKWKAIGKLRSDLEDEMILAIFKAIPYIDLHKEDIGIQYFPQIIDYITEYIMKGLTERPK